MNEPGFIEEIEAESCYWEHTNEQELIFPCFDGESIVCARCCVENCPTEYPELFAKCAAAGHPTWTTRTAPPTKVPAKLVILETYWDDDQYTSTSVRNFLEALSPLLDPPLRVVHRFVESHRGLAYYTKQPKGLLWKDRSLWNTPVYYLAFHGSPGTIWSFLNSISTEKLCRAFKNYGDYDCLFYFGACSVLKGQQGRNFAQQFLQVSGCRAVIGYTTDMDWFACMMTDLLFMHHFYNDEDPWTNLRTIVDKVKAEYPVAQELGWTCLLREDSNG